MDEISGTLNAISIEKLNEEKCIEDPLA